jgi:TonB family protein
MIGKLEPDRLPESTDSEELAWNRLELFRSQIVSRKPRRWPKPTLGIAIVVIILAVPAYQLFKLRTTQNPGDRAGSTRGPAGSSKTDISKSRINAESMIKVAPTYPRLPQSKRVGGTVLLEADINEKGDVVRAKAVSGPYQLRKAAEQALLKWKFKPASVNGVSIASKEQVAIDFAPPR